MTTAQKIGIAVMAANPPMTEEKVTLVILFAVVFSIVSGSIIAWLGDQ